MSLSEKDKKSLISTHGSKSGKMIYDELNTGISTPTQGSTVGSEGDSDSDSDIKDDPKTKKPGK